MGENDKGKNGLKKSRSLLLTGRFNEDMTKDALNTILDYVGESPKEPITIYINSYGGYIDEAFAIVDLIEHFKSMGVEFHTICIGKAMSCGSAILISGTKGKRSITRNARILIHQISASSFGTCADLEAEMEETVRQQRQWEQHYARNVGCNIKTVREWMSASTYMTPQEALKNGIVDKIERR